MLDAHRLDAFPKRAPRQGVVRTVDVQDIRSPARTTEQAGVDPSKEEDDDGRVHGFQGRTQVRLFVTPVVATRTRLTPPSPPPCR
jgi:hypothetical protein